MVDPTRIERAVPYDPALPWRLLDIHHPAPGAANGAGMLVLHGGGFRSGRRDDGVAASIAGCLAQAGFTAFSIDYRLPSPGAPVEPCFPGNYHDCRCALLWIRSQAVCFGLDPARLGAIGHSAGGCAALCLGCCAQDPYFAPPGLEGPGVRAVVNLYAPTDGEWDAVRHGYAATCDLEWARRHSPVRWVTAAAAPTLTLHGGDDRLVSPEHAWLLHRAFQAVGAQHEVEIIPGAPHSFGLNDGARDLRPRVLAFLARHLGG